MDQRALDDHNVQMQLAEFLNELEVVPITAAAKSLLCCCTCNVVAEDGLQGSSTEVHGL